MRRIGLYDGIDASPAAGSGGKGGAAIKGGEGGRGGHINLKLATTVDCDFGVVHGKDGVTMLQVYP
jgi:hypothetical protein